jgi:hypothetical protein
VTSDPLEGAKPNAPPALRAGWGVRRFQGVRAASTALQTERADPLVAGGREAEARERDSLRLAPTARRAAGGLASTNASFMVNRLKDCFDTPEPRPPDDDYYVVSQRFEDFYVTREVAERIPGHGRAAGVHCAAGIE